jgi:hypothetical protein
MRRLVCLLIAVALLVPVAALSVDFVRQGEPQRTSGSGTDSLYTSAGVDTTTAAEKRARTNGERPAGGLLLWGEAGFKYKVLHQDPSQPLGFAADSLWTPVSEAPYAVTILGPAWGAFFTDQEDTVRMWVLTR